MKRRIGKTNLILAAALCLSATPAFAYEQVADLKTETKKVLDKTKDAVNDALTASKAAVMDQAGKRAVNVDFMKGEAAIPTSQRGDLEALLKSVDEREAPPGEGTVVVAAWSDHTYPSEPGKALSAADIAIAQKRAESILAVVQATGRGFKVRFYNMAEQQPTLEDAFSPPARQSADAETQKIAHVLIEKGKVSSAVVIVYGPGTKQ